MVVDVVEKLLPIRRIATIHDVDGVASAAAMTNRDGVAAPAIPSLDEVDFDEIRHLKRACCSSRRPSAEPATTPCTTGPT